MPYATLPDLVDRIGELELIQLTDRIGAAVIDEAVLARTQADADALIDRYVATRYSLPLSPPVAASLAREACAIVHYYLLGQAAENKEARQRYEDAIRVLEGIARGTASLADGAAAPPPGAGNTVIMQSAGSVFSRERR